jgi:hypothetical protein
MKHASAESDDRIHGSSNRVQTVTVCTKDVMHESTERGERGGVPSPAGALLEPLAM